MTAYRALALQVTCHSVSKLDAAAARAAMRAAIERIGRQVDASADWIGPDLRLVVLPEYVLTGFPIGGSIADWRDKAAIAPGGPEYALLAGIAARNHLYLAGNAYETDPYFPDLYFQASFVLSPAGETVLRYRRLHSMFSPTPYDVWDRYLKVYGTDQVLPVARTEIGALAAIASEEILFPELARALALRGAEVFVHSSSEAGSPRLLPKPVARLARAAENAAYVVSANCGGLAGTDFPQHATDGGSAVIGFDGRVLAEAGPGETMVAAAELDLAALRRARSRPGMENLIARVKTTLWAGEYARHDVDRPNGLASAVPGRGYFMAAHQAAIERLKSAGIVP